MASWRQQQRQPLIAARQALPEAERERIQSLCLSYISDYLAQCQPGILGLYWPIKGELDCRQLAESLLAQGWILTVPVINNTSKQLEFA